MRNFLILLALFSACNSLYLPEQVHIALDWEDTGMRVSWSADQPSYGSVVQYTPVNSPNDTVTKFAYSNMGSWKTFLNMDVSKILQRHIHVCTALMSGLIPGGYYKYRVGSEMYGWSSHFAFRAKRNFTDDPLIRLLVYGDFGIGQQAEATTERLIQETETYHYDAILHDGDMAYDFPSYDGSYGDRFMRQIEPYASKIPYMTSQGNHEADTATLHYLYRFNMPSKSKNLWYSFNLGKVHFLAYTSEPPFWNQTGLQKQQQEFIDNDLSTYNRTEYPWLVVFGHRPLYCSANWSTSGLEDWVPPVIRNNNDCLQDAQVVRNTFEELWHKYKVDFVINAHVHAYERLASVYHNVSVPCEYEDQNTCIGASEPVFVVTGTPGNQESYAPISPTPLPFSMAQDAGWGYSRLTVFNSTHLYWEQIRSVDQTISDWFWLIKSSKSTAYN
ncbi:hypothetical protein SteCoe_7272 [Stentor coeruleus]|uniref:Purple acid phosphatase n=1 Tax=Stentor coeruleus TaxID=5963 RepID=A0A1R2CMW6_9CILI|nr:hypothetical protein SteCoe_7272 [Stentor coeruleus]